MLSVKKFKQFSDDPAWWPLVDPGDGRLIRALWASYPGSQEKFLAASELEVLLGGSRGGGKTAGLLMCFGQYTGLGFGSAWRGAIFRRHIKELDELVKISGDIFPMAFPGIRYNIITKTWTWPSGETLQFLHFTDVSQIPEFRGRAWPFIGFEELTTWPNDEVYKFCFTLIRSTMPGMPRMLRSTTNPSGVGHNWVAIRFRLSGIPSINEPVILDSLDAQNKLEPPRRYIHSAIEENLLMMKNDPGYIDRLCSGATSESMFKAYRWGDWSITSGGMFDDIWHTCREWCVVPRFQSLVPPPTWRITEALDSGSSKPFALGWFCESDGTDVIFEGGQVRSTKPGDLFLFKEWYGWSGHPNKGLPHLTIPDIAKGIIERRKKWGITKRVRPGVADTGIFDEVHGMCDNETYAKHGVHWEPASKGPFSRIEGWNQFRMRLKATIPVPGIGREEKGLYVVGEDCPQFLRTIPVLARSEKDPDDADTEGEDHIADMVRYRLRFDSGPRVSFKRRTT